MSLAVQTDGLRDSPEVQIPSTPIPNHPSPPAPREDDMPVPKTSTSSPRARSSSDDMTPPPSSQAVNGRSSAVGSRSLSSSQQYPASPPATVKVKNTFSVPSEDEILNANEQQLRGMVNELVTAVREARMSAAHFKLQHSLLSMESHESAQRAEVEHQMTRREVEVLKSEQRVRKNSAQGPRMMQISPQPATEPLLSRCRELELENAILERRLDKAKILIEESRDRADLIQDENLLLKRRIRENRDHYSRMKSQSPAFASPRNEFTTPQRRTAARYPNTNDSQNTAFDVLLAADRVLMDNATSVPSTPTKTPASRMKHRHTRGAHSLSSLQSTPGRSDILSLSKPVVQQSRSHFSAPSTQVHFEPSRHDRDSTISISGDEEEDEAVTDEELPQSQASSRATNMLRRNPGPSQQSSQDSVPSVGTPASAEKQSNLLQAKLFGHVKKAGLISSMKSPKRRVSFGEDDLNEKKRKLKTGTTENGNSEGVGLGIDKWDSPRR